jgi:hypothetical protein
VEAEAGNADGNGWSGFAGREDGAGGDDPVDQMLLKDLQAIDSN